ncbi:hypothetical protein [uncultured Erythrobacter sp.]|uniref:hypothetical protein n=1 Tax=uncultured Erythrobacter sp. TaxID=263913 RepID=UPI00262CDCA5|nr:hypothetical protein [uncultured Erythrobacter sp.]
MHEKISIRTWLISLAVFVFVIFLSSRITQGDVTFDILAHQAAGTADRVNEIQTQWREAGVQNSAIVAMIGDLAWIWIYAFGSFLAGREFATKREGVLRVIGLFICVAGVVFGITDYTETISQFIQLLQDTGSDTLAGIAAFMQPIKVTAFLVAFFGVIIAVVMDRFVGRSTPSG